MIDYDNLQKSLKHLELQFEDTAVRLTAGDTLASDCFLMVYTAIYLAAI